MGIGVLITCILAALDIAGVAHVSVLTVLLPTLFEVALELLVFFGVLLFYFITDL